MSESTGVTKEMVEDYYSRLPMLTPPKEIIVLKNASIGAETLYDSNEMGWRIFGMHRTNSDRVFVAGDAPATTFVHEGIHANGVQREGLTRMLTKVAMLRSQLNLGLFRKQVHYHAVAVTPEERDRILKDMHLSNPGGQNVELIRLVYSPVG